MLFADKSKFIDSPSDYVDYAEESWNSNIREKLTYASPSLSDGHFIAHIPQDFNLNINTNGDISGVNPGDSKLLTLESTLKTVDGDITLRRMKTNDCLLRGNKVHVTSSLEAARLKCEAGQHGFSVGKRLGIGS